MEMHLLHEHLAKVKHEDFEREVARESVLREARGGVGAGQALRRRLAGALVVLADRLDPALPAGSAGVAGAPLRLG